MKLVIFGTGGFGREVLQVAKDCVEAGADWEIAGFLDGAVERHGTRVQGLEVLGGIEWLAANPEAAVTVAVGNPATKRRLCRSIEATGHHTWATLVHPRAWLGREVELGQGTTVCAGACITTDVRLGAHVIVNLSATIGHDARLDDFVTLAPGVNVSGAVHLASGVDVGTGAAIIQNISVGAWSIVGAGSVVVRDLEANVTAVGAPARAVKTREAGWHEAGDG